MAAHYDADIAVVSAANAGAVEEEWTFNELREHVQQQQGRFLKS